MAHEDLTFNVIGATMESPSKTPPACLYKPGTCGNKAGLFRWNPCRIWFSVASDCLSLAEGLGWRTAGSPLLRTHPLCWGKFHCLSLSVECPPYPYSKGGFPWRKYLYDRFHKFGNAIKYILELYVLFIPYMQEYCWFSLLEVWYSYRWKDHLK